MVQVKFHDIGEGINEGEILSYFVDVGETVKVDQPLMEVQTDKMVAEIPSPAAGTIKAIHLEPGKIVTVGTVILEIDDGSDQSITDRKASTPKPQQHSSIKGPKRIIATPFARKVARQNGVDIKHIEGSGPRGRVTVDDIQRHVKGESMQEANQTNLQVKQSVIPETIQKDEKESDSLPFKGIRKQIAKNMVRSLSTIPHVTHFDEVDLTNIMEFRKELKDTGENISVVAFFIKAIAIALKDYRIFNSRLNEEREVIQLHSECNIGLATDTEKGLIVPVLHNVNQKTIREINAEIKTLTKRAQDGELSAAEMRNGTFTISNVGPLGGTGATPVINFPQTGIISFHKAKKKPVVMASDEIAIRTIMTLSFSFDHRVADGATAVSFTNRFIELMEELKKLLFELS